MWSSAWTIFYCPSELSCKALFLCSHYLFKKGTLWGSRDLLVLEIWHTVPKYYPEATKQSSLFVQRPQWRQNILTARCCDHFKLPVFIWLMNWFGRLATPTLAVSLCGVSEDAAGAVSPESEALTQAIRGDQQDLDSEQLAAAWSVPPEEQLRHKSLIPESEWAATSKGFGGRAVTCLFPTASVNMVTASNHAHCVRF